MGVGMGWGFGWPYHGQTIIPFHPPRPHRVLPLLFLVIRISMIAHSYFVRRMVRFVVMLLLLLIASRQWSYYS